MASFMFTLRNEIKLLGGNVIKDKDSHTQPLCTLVLFEIAKFICLN